MDIGGYRISRDGETVSVGLIGGVNPKTERPRITPVAYVRDFRDAVYSVQRKMSVRATESKDLKEALEVLDTQHKELMGAIKAGCKECLDEVKE